MANISVTHSLHRESLSLLRKIQEATLKVCIRISVACQKKYAESLLQVFPLANSELWRGEIRVPTCSSPRPFADRKASLGINVVGMAWAQNIHDKFRGRASVTQQLSEEQSLLAGTFQFMRGSLQLEVQVTTNTHKFSIVCNVRYGIFTKSVNSPGFPVTKPLTACTSDC